MQHQLCNQIVDPTPSQVNKAHSYAHAPYKYFNCTNFHQNECVEAADPLFINVFRLPFSLSSVDSHIARIALSKDVPFDELLVSIYNRVAAVSADFLELSRYQQNVPPLKCISLDVHWHV